MRHLSDALSCWDGAGGGLKLQISAWSPSDTSHGFFECEMEAEYPFRFETDLAGLAAYQIQRRADRAAASSTHVHDNSLGALQRLFGNGLNFTSWLSKTTATILPPTPIVKGLVLRGLFYRGIAPVSLAKVFHESLVALESLHIERWMRPWQGPDTQSCKEIETILIPALPASVKRFVFHQRTVPTELLTYELPLRQAYGELTRKLALECHRFTEFSLTVMDDGWFVWLLVELGRRDDSKLELMCLRYTILFRKVCRPRILSFLQLVALATKNLPRLRILEVWNLDRKTGYFLRYTQHSYRATLTWICVGRALPLSSTVVEQWAAVAPAGYHFDVIQDVITEDNVANNDEDDGEDNNEDGGEVNDEDDGEDDNEDDDEDDGEGDDEEEGEEGEDEDENDSGARSVRDEKFVFRKLMLQGLAYDPLTLAQVEAGIERTRAERWNT
ncbi:hypothetical protein S40293_03249 [Stachybotrys chartarum IBT 40293]|nr:hypothetical protein S40293_03249 [Stachybotrys chartarum IBT 40293]